MDSVKVLITDLENNIHELEGLEGWRLMEVIRDNGLPIKAECGGACACATCHVYIAEKWLPKLVPPTDEEVRMMDDAFFVKPNSRLSCQILLSKEIEGLEATIAPFAE